jgi:hypothetical protein
MPFRGWGRLHLPSNQFLIPPRHGLCAGGVGGYIFLAKGDAYNPFGQCGVQIDNQYAVI